MDGRAWVLYKELTDIVDSLKPRDYSEAYASIHGVCQKLWAGDAEVKVTGSYLQQTAISSSDLDVGLGFPKRMRVLGDAYHLRRLSKHVDAHPESGLKGTHSCLQASVPVLRFLHLASNITIDISVSSEHTGKTDEIISSLITCNPTILPTIYVVKHWAQRRKVVGAYEGFLNSISWVALVVSYCQSLELIPPVVGIQSWKGCSNPPPTAELLTNFFAWIGGAKGDRAALRCSLETGEHEETKSEKPLFLEDPGKKGNNLASSTRRGMWHDVVKECRRAAAMIRSDKNFSDILESSDASSSIPSPPVSPIPVVGVTTSSMAVEASKSTLPKKYVPPGKRPGNGLFPASPVSSSSPTFCVGMRVYSTELNLKIEGTGNESLKGTITGISSASKMVTVKFDGMLLGDISLSAGSLMPLAAEDDTISSDTDTSSTSAESAIFSQISSSSGANSVNGYGHQSYQGVGLGLPAVPSCFGYASFPQLPVPLMPPDCAINPVQAPIRKI
eukprot:TRINITY_DN1355_c3_g1_i1.p1 TRINITY_DN1355_c3_g1~~TRINITY_DN1355_c3_g1_i1.p1  ORF type:complete len:536 (+),score=48.66 TRINITY_DN1355_c3_g1_i1:103-1608(+)